VTAARRAPKPPLARLFAIAFHSLIDELHGELRDRGWTDVRPSFGFVLLATRDGSTTSTALAELLGTSKQAASKLVDLMEVAGYVTRATDTADSRQRLVSLTRRGAELLSVVEEIYVSLERQWANVIGRRELETLRSNLVKVLTSASGGALPSVRPST
jgi:DNA-binding MarR family transcriptional regulator